MCKTGRSQGLPWQPRHFSDSRGARVGSHFHRRNPVRINGKVVTEQDIDVVSSGGEFCLASHRAHEWFSVYVPIQLLHQAPNDLEFAARARPHMLKSPPGVTRQFTTLVHRFLTAAEARPQLLESPNAIASVQNELLASVKQLFMTSQHSASRHDERWREQTLSATDAALKEPELGMVVSEAATQLGVPERTLRAAFQSCYGLFPVKYLRILRLQQARQLLLASCPDQSSVTQIALRVGIWELGRFARDYRKLFGELPSATLHKPIRKPMVRKALGIKLLGGIGMIHAIDALSRWCFEVALCPLPERTAISN